MYTSLTVHKTGVYKRKTSPVTHGLHHIFVLNTFIHYITGIQHGLKKKRHFIVEKKTPTTSKQSMRSSTCKMAANA